MRHIVFLKSHAKTKGGLEKYASKLMAFFLEEGYQVSLLTTNADCRVENVTVHATKKASWPPSFRLEKFDRFVQKFLQNQNVDIVFGMDRNRFQTHLRAGNGVHASYLKSRLFSEGRLKMISSYLNPLHRKILKFEKEAFENPLLQKLFTNSHMVKNEVLEHYRVDPDKIEVVHNGVEWHLMQESFNSSEKKEGPFHFLFIGNGYLRKGLHLLLSALSKIKDQNFVLSVVGKDRRETLFRKKAAELNLGNKVFFFGEARETIPFYQKADALVIPSFYDPFANVTVEALAMGLFVISSKKNGGHEVLTEENGKIIENLLDEDEFIAALKQAMTFPKTYGRAFKIRESVKHLDFSRQLKTIVKTCAN